MNELMTRERNQLASLDSVAEAAEAFVAASRAANTTKAYDADWKHFATWCDQHGVSPFPASPQVVALYLADLASRYKYSTIQRRSSALSVVYQAAGDENPVRSALARTTLAGIRRTLGTAPQQVTAAVVQDLRVMVSGLPDGTIGIRDRALLLVGFAAALRRSELVALNADDVVEVPEGLVVTVRRSKADQDGAGRKIAVPFGSHIETCPVRSLRSWRENAGIADGPLFRRIDRHGNVGPRLTAAAVALVVKRAAANAGLDATSYSGHSLRAGLATSAAAANVPERIIAETTGHRSMTTLRRYVRNGSLFHDIAASHVGL